MARINGVKSYTYSPSGNIFTTKRVPMDTSELYIKSSLNHIYNRTVADCFVKEKLGNIRSFVGNGQADRNLNLA